MGVVCVCVCVWGGCYHCGYMTWRVADCEEGWWEWCVCVGGGGGGAITVAT